MRCPLHLLPLALLLPPLLASSGNRELQLHRSLLEGYDGSSRPVRSADSVVNVTVTVQLKRLLDLDEKNQILHFSVVVVESWRDERLSWRPEAFDDLRVTTLPATTLWLPDLYIFNNAADGDSGFVYDNTSRVTLAHSGWVLWSIPLIVHSSCSVDVLYFPFDHQFCDILLGSWTYDVRQLRLRIPDKLKVVDASDLEENSELKVLHVAAQARARRRAGHLRQSLALRLHIERKPLYYNYTVIAPSIMLCVLTLCSFCLPCHCAEKVEIGLTVFLFLYFLQLLISENTPESNSTPLIGIFLTLVMIFNCLSLIMSTVVTHVHSRSENDPCPQVPEWLWALMSKYLGPVTLSGTELLLPNLRTSFEAHEEAARRRSSKFDQTVESAKWRLVSQITDRFLLLLFLAAMLLASLLLLHVVPKSSGKDARHFNWTSRVF